ncbi:MAG: cell division protein FtsA [bacterium]
MSKKFSVGIDIGTYQVKVIVAEQSDEAEDSSSPLRIIGVGLAESRGLRHGYIINCRDVTKSLSSAIEQAEKTSGQKIRNASISIGGIGLSSITTAGSIMTSKSDSEITELDVNNAIANAEDDLPKSVTQNKKILHTIPLTYKIDGKVVFGEPIGMHGDKLEVKVMFIVCTEHHFNDLIQAVEDLDINVTGYIASPLAGAVAVSTKTQRIAGCVVANIGSETVSVVAFENNLPISLEVFSIGGTDITNDIALGLRISLDEAEEVKIKQSDMEKEINYSRRKLDEIIVARLSDIFDLIEAHLKKIGRSGLLPAGIILTGGTSGLSTIEELAKATLRLPTKIASLNFSADQIKNGLVRDSSWLVAYGLCLIKSNKNGDYPFISENGIEINHGQLWDKISHFFRKFSP